MSQNAVITQRISPDVVQVSLLLPETCKKSCPSCVGCGKSTQTETIAFAQDPFGVQEGQQVEIKANIEHSLLVSFCVFILPCISMFSAYLLGQYLGFHEIFSLFLALCAVPLGLIPAKYLEQKHQKAAAPEFIVCSLLPS